MCQPNEEDEQSRQEAYRAIYSYARLAIEQAGQTPEQVRKQILDLAASNAAHLGVYFQELAVSTAQQAIDDALAGEPPRY